MKFGMGLPVLMLYPAVMSRWEPEAPAGAATRVAQKADELGFDLVTIPEHIIIPDEMAEVMGRRYTEAWTAAAFLAGATQRVRVLTFVLVVPYRHPIMLAKQVATLDFLSGGRTILGAAVGHMQREFELLGADFKERGPVTDEYLAAMKELWTSDAPEFHGKYVQFERVAFEPKPVQKPHPPIWVGGNSRPAMRRVARHGDGWIPYLVRKKQLPECMEYIRSQPEFQANPRELDIVVPLATFNIEDYSHKELGKTEVPRGKDQTVDEIGRWRDAGATGVLANMLKTPNVEALLEQMEWFASEVMPAFK
jgi:probable F420-dependent oxidoreductase